MAVVIAVALVARGALAAPHRPGANHHLGDDSFVEQYGRLPDAGDPEPLRMHVHLAYVRALLGDAPATRPALAARRAELLGYLDAYIANAATPHNTDVPHRSPVFIDRDGRICAVGYLIERTAGRALAERIAAAHRFDVLEDIAAAEPEVQAWVAASGFTLDELASIQPAYEEPRATAWHTWDLARWPQPDGPHDRFGTGVMKHQRMEGPWKVRDEGGHVVGSGAMTHGTGTWTSYYPDGKVRAVGPYVANKAHGAWTLYHLSGRIAAEGSFRDGDRAGVWTFYADTERTTPLATGRFRGGEVSGVWKHFDAEGRLAATTHEETPFGMWPDNGPQIDGGDGFELAVATPAGAVAHRIHQGTVGGQFQRLELLERAGERMYVHSVAEGSEVLYDVGGRRLEHGAAGWTTSDCGWSALRKRVAGAGDLAFLHGLLYHQAQRRGLVTPYFFDTNAPEPPKPRPIACVAPRPVEAERAARLDALIAGRATSPRVDEIALGMKQWQEWAAIDQPFEDLFATMPGRFRKMWVDGDPQDPRNY